MRNFLLSKDFTLSDGRTLLSDSVSAVLSKGYGYSAEELDAIEECVLK